MKNFKKYTFLIVPLVLLVIKYLDPNLKKKAINVLKLFLICYFDASNFFKTLCFPTTNLHWEFMQESHHKRSPNSVLESQVWDSPRGYKYKNIYKLDDCKGDRCPLRSLQKMAYGQRVVAAGEGLIRHY